MKLNIIPKLFLVLLTIMLMIGCDNIATKEFGGTMNVELETNRKLVNVTWKNSDVWYLTKPMLTNDVEEVYELQEKSTFGVMNGKVIISEHKQAASN